MKALAPCIALVLLLAISRSVLGAPAAPDETEAAIQRGRQHMLQGEYEFALREFLIARSKVETPRVTAQIGFAEQALSRWVESEQHLADALTATDDPWIQKNQPYIERAIATVREHLASLVLRGTPSGALVKINRSPAAFLPFKKPKRVVAGEVEIEVSYPGYETRQMTIVFTPATSLERTIDLQPIPASAPVPEPVIPAPRPRVDENRSGTGGVGLFSWCTLAVGAAGLVGGIALSSHSPRTGAVMTGIGGIGILGASFGIVWSIVNHQAGSPAAQSATGPTGAFIAGSF